MSDAILEVRHLSKSFGSNEVLRDIDFDVRPGDVTSIIGASGSGKSTLLRCINLLETPTSGDVIFHGESVINGKVNPNAYRAKVGMVFQSFNLFPNKDLLHNIMLAPMVVKKMKEEEARDLSMKMLEKVGLAGFANRYPSTLSGGQSQRAAIARALAMNPRVMLYDEPTSALDPELVGEVLHVMKELDAEGMTQIIVTHEMKFAKDASDYIIFMDKGEIVEYEDGDILFANPKNERTRAFLRHFVNAGVTC